MGRFRSKSFQISFKTTVLSIFFAITALLIVVLSIQLIYLGRELSYDSIEERLELVSREVKTSLISSDIINQNIVEALSLQKDANQKLYASILRNSRSLYAIYTGYKNGGFFEIINLDIHGSLRKIYDAKSGDRWLFVHIDGSDTSKKTITMLDEALNVTSTKTETTDYDPRKRPWYIQAENKDSTIKTKPYDFSNISAKGITYAKKIENGEDVVGIDVLIYDIESIFHRYIDPSSMQMFLIQQDQTIFSSSTQDRSLMYDFFSDRNDVLSSFEKPERIDINDKSYIVQISRLDIAGEEHYIALFANYDKIMAPYIDKIIDMALIFFATVLLVAPVTIYSSLIIVRPIQKLIEQNNRIKKRNFKNIKIVDTPIAEVYELSKSFTDMTNAIHSYQTVLEHKVAQRTKELYKKNEELFRLSITDKLTGLHNRVKLDEALSAEIAIAKRYGTPFSLVIMDIDHFKKVNDTFGHQVGDEVLVEIAEILRKCTRETDTLGRWGGEEFLVVCPTTDICGAKVLADKINKYIREHKRDKAPERITMSLGVAAYRASLSIDNMLSNADTALYRAKHKGRDRVEVYESDMTMLVKS